MSLSNGEIAMFESFKRSIQNLFYKIILPSNSADGITIDNEFIPKCDIPCWDDKEHHLACFCGKDCPVPYLRCMLSDKMIGERGLKCAHSL